MLKFIDRWEENPYTLNKAEYTWLANIAETLGIKSVLEFGPGSSTFAFLEHGCEIWSLENNLEWLAKHRETLIEFSNVHLAGYEVVADLVLDGIPNRRFDCAFVDAPNGGDYFKYHSRLCSLDFARTRTDLIFLHDANRPKEIRSIEYMHDKGWAIRDNCPDSERGFVLLERDDGWKPIMR
jgi:hypothetical protein